MSTPELKKQHRKPCATCPFTDKCEPGETGGSSVEVYVGQTFGPFWVPCHEQIDYEDPNWKRDYDTPQCVGHAIMRDKTGAHQVMPETLLRVESYEGDRVFDSIAAFWAYHKQCSIEEALSNFTKENLVTMVLDEFMRSGADFKRPDSIRNVNEPSDA